ncbi:MAG: aminotransferase class V-fold PLP-dependent enzyme, partial [Lentisphaeria bacterium]|nr:aminotransferase class V-fold PLP-dependent enzyme [Lentisphaeria bacterium]
METADLDKIEMPGVQTRLTSEEEQALLKVLREGNSLATGSEGEAFEREFADFIGCPDAVAVSSCSAALELAAILSGLESGDEVIIPAHTFCATAVPFGRTGATIRWADIDPDTRLISAASIRSLITERTKAVVIVHLYGLAADMDGIMAVADEHDLIVIEDCAQAPGAHYNGRRTGSIG